MLDGPSLEPSHGISKFIGDDAYTVEVGIIEINLIVGVSPTISNGHSSKVNASGSHKSVIVDQFAPEGRDVVPCEGLTSDIEGTGLEGGPLVVQVEEEVDQMVSSLLG